MSHSIRNAPYQMALLVGMALATQTPASAEGEPAGEFVQQLRNVGYFDTAITYLDRVAEIPGVDAEFIAAVPLEKAQTYIESARSSRSKDDRDKFFVSAESSLTKFLENPTHARAPEARLQLGKLQMIRASQLISGEPDQTNPGKARESYLAASKTFDGIVADLKKKLEGMRGQRIDPSENPEAAARRDTYQVHYLQSQVNAADAIKLAAKTYENPKKDGKKILEDAAKRLTEIYKKYDDYAPGIIALVHLGEVYELLGDSDAALENYLNMLEASEDDRLRDAKFLAAAGLARIKMSASPPKPQEAIDRVSSWGKQIRNNERTLPSVQEFRIELAKAYLAKAQDQSLKRIETSRAKSEGRSLLQDSVKVPGPHLEEAKTMLAELGIEQEAPQLPTAEPPENFDDAMEKAQEILQLSQDWMTRQQRGSAPWHRSSRHRP